MMPQKHFFKDYEFSRRPMEQFLTTYNLGVVKTPARRHNNTGIVKRKHLTAGTILERATKKRIYIYWPMQFSLCKQLF